MARENSRRRRPHSWRIERGTVALVVVCSLSTLGCHAQDPPPDPTRDVFFLFTYPGIREPPTVPAANSPIPEDEDVIGISVGSRARAYRLKAFGHPTTHIVNDLVGDVPITVTYCDANQCTQAFTHSTRGVPLDISQGGQMRRSQEMIIRADGHGFRQRSLQFEPQAGLAEVPPTFPYPTHPFTLTTWKKWREAHPDTDVYMGVSNVVNP
ncbi:MAG: DUF3179 domain-containing (seleno)protein [Isosphaeraceae bacterium]|nr:DUF3179 domain-containing (seleno)protein [Isosphaeraceae bacterium]